MSWIKEMEMVDSVGDLLKSSRSIQGYIHFPNIEMLDARIVSALNKIIQNSYFKKGQSGGTESSDRWSVRGGQIAHMIYNYFRVTGAHDAVLDYADLFTITVRNDDVQEFITRWDSFVYDQDPTWWRPGKFVQLENTWVWSAENRIRILWHGNSENIDAWLSEVENDGQEKKHSGLKFWRLKWEDWSSGCELQGIKVVLKEDTEFAINGKEQGSVREETSVVSGTTGISVQNQHQKPLHLLSHQHKEVEVRRGKRISEAGVHLGSSIDSRAKTSWKVCALNHFVTISILPNVNSTSLNRVVNSAISVRLHTSRLRVNPAKKTKNDGDKSAVAILKDARQSGSVFQDTAAGIFVDFTEEPKKSLD